MSKAVVISQPYFFPWIGLFEQVNAADVFVHYDDVQFVSRHFQDRVQIKTPQRFKWITIPKQDFHQNQLIKEIKIDNSGNWKEKQLQFLKVNYHRAPFRKEMIKIAEIIYSQNYDYLADLTVSSIMEPAGYFNLTRGKQFVRSSGLGIGGRSSQRLLDIVRYFKGDRYITGMGALNYLDFELFEQYGIRVEFVDYQKKEYPQLYGEFNPYVSILDLIANTGSLGAGYICSGTSYWKDYIKKDIAKSYLKESGNLKR